MKLVIRSELPAELQAELKDSRFVLVEPSYWGIPKVIVSGNDPAFVARGGVEPTFETPTSDQMEKVIELMGSGLKKHAAYSQVGIRITSPHYYARDQVVYEKGDLFRIDETRRAS